MASRSPYGAAGNTVSAGEDYTLGWLALTRLMREGASWSGRERNCCWLNLGDGRFADASFASGLDFIDDGRAVAAVDWDGDGDLDLWLKNRTGPQLRFMRNEFPGGSHFIAFRLVGKTCNRDAVGARVEVQLDGRVLRRDVTAGDGYLAQSSRWLHFGLGDAERVQGVTVHWPGGDSEVLGSLDVDRRYRVVQGADKAEPLAPRGLKPLPAPPATEALPPPARVLLKVPLQAPPSVRRLLYPEGPSGRAKLINLWAHWCAPCVEELGAMAARYSEIQRSGLDIVPLSLDMPQDLDRAARLFTEQVTPRMSGPGFGQQAAPADVMETLDAILLHVLQAHDEVVLPTSFLFDRDGYLQLLYLGPVVPAQLLADSWTYATPEVRIKGARRSLFEGRWYFRTPRDLRGLASDLRRRGRREDARFYFALQQLERRPPSPAN